MTNKEFLERALKLQKEFAELYGNTGLIGISNNQIQIRDDRFHELEKENLLEHILKKYQEDEFNDYWRYEAMTLDGVRVITLEDVGEAEEEILTK